MNIGEVVRHNGEVMIFLESDVGGPRCLALDQHDRLYIEKVEGEVEPIKYEHLTIFLKNRLLFLKDRYEKVGE